MTLPRVQARTPRPHTNFRDPHASIQLPAYRDLVQPRSGVQPRSESVAAPLVPPDAANVEVLTDFQPVNPVGNLAVLARLLDAWTEIGVLQRDAVSVAARGIDNLTGRDGTASVSPVAPSPTVCC